MSKSSHKTTYQLISRDAEQTWQLGRLIGQLLHDGIVIRLIGELGAGKTCFVQGLAAGLEVPDAFAVTSPTYTLINEFSGRLPLYHADLYRIHSSEDAEVIGFYDIVAPNHVVVVEWADRLADSDYPPEALTLHFHLNKDDSRRIELIGSGLPTRNLIKKIGPLWDIRVDGIPK